MWALGILLFFMMYGAYPFEGKYEGTVVAAIVTKKKIKPSQKMEEKYSESLKKILSSLLSYVCFVLFVLFIFFFINEKKVRCICMYVCIY
jgi:serine/threonine protein kinase